MTLKQESTESGKNLNNVIKIDRGQIQNHLDQIVRGTVEETLNSMLDAEADQLCNADRYQRSEARKDTTTNNVYTNVDPILQRAVDQIPTGKWLQ